MVTIAEELRALTKLSPKQGEEPAEYAYRLAHKVNDVPDDDWAKLTDEAQNWVNNAIEKLELRQPVPPPDGLSKILGKSNGNGHDADPAPIKATAKHTETTKHPPKPKAPKATKAKDAPKATKAKEKPKPKTTIADVPILTTGSIDRSRKIKILVEKNPYKKGTGPHNNFPKYTEGMTVEEAYKAGIRYTNLVWDKHRGFIDW